VSGTTIRNAEPRQRLREPRREMQNDVQSRICGRTARLRRARDLEHSEADIQDSTGLVLRQLRADTLHRRSARPARGSRYGSCLESSDEWRTKGARLAQQRDAVALVLTRSTPKRMSDRPDRELRCHTEGVQPFITCAPKAQHRRFRRRRIEPCLQRLNVSSSLTVHVATRLAPRCFARSGVRPSISVEIVSTSGRASPRTHNRLRRSNGAATSRGHETVWWRRGCSSHTRHTMV